MIQVQADSITSTAACTFIFLSLLVT